MIFDANKHHRRSIRLAGFDYGTAGAYFVTICVAHRRCAFGQICNGALRLHSYGQIVVEEWNNSTALRSEIELDEFVVMPNHFHAIVWLVETHDSTPLPSSNRDTPLPSSNRDTPSPSRNLGALINGFKGAVTRRINTHRAERDFAPVVVWQRNYYERIIHDEKELNDTRRYIIENPLHWKTDSENQHQHP